MNRVYYEGLEMGINSVKREYIKFYFLSIIKKYIRTIYARIYGTKV